MRGRVDEPRSPILFSSAPVETPGYSFSTIKHVNCFPLACANVMNMSAKAAFVIHIFSPFMIQCVPSGLRTAFVFAASASEPLPDSDNAYAEIFSPVQSRGRYLLLCCSLPKYTIGSVPIPLWPPYETAKDAIR